MGAGSVSSASASASTASSKRSISARKDALSSSCASFCASVTPSSVPLPLPLSSVSPHPHSLPTVLSLPLSPDPHPPSIGDTIAPSLHPPFARSTTTTCGRARVGGRCCSPPFPALTDPHHPPLPTRSRPRGGRGTQVERAQEGGVGALHLPYPCRSPLHQCRSPHPPILVR
ncbi:hypothetical protein B0H13DRAFT_2558904 [Mycena leptocephala]|nr:hypothetical protein B0H13DRAFT_2558904 [Mycena leptocephala]